PIVPPTDEAVRECLRWTDRDSREVVAVLPPRQGEATVERIAINAVMAGARPEYLPVIITAVEALADPDFNLDSIHATTHPVAHCFPADVSTVTPIGCEAPHNIQALYSYTGLGILKIIAGAMGQAGSNNLLAAGHPLLSLGPEHAATMARDGYSKQQVKEFVFEHARFPLAKLGEEYQRHHVESGKVPAAPDTMLPIVKSPEDLSVIV